MIKRMTAAAVVAVMLAAPATASAGPPDSKIKTILLQIAEHSCEVANRVAEAWGIKGGICSEEAPPAEEVPTDPTKK